MEVKVGDFVVSSNERGTQARWEKLSDIGALIADPGVGCLVGASGGYNSIALFKEIDIEQISEARKAICGFSDLSALNVAITMASGLVTFTGPSMLPVFGFFGGVDKFTYESMRSAICDHRVALDNSSLEIRYSSAYWDHDDDAPVPVVRVPASFELRAGVMEGRCFSANLSSLLAYIAAGLILDQGPSLWFVDDNSKSLSLLERDMVALVNSQVLSSCAGIIVSRNPNFLVGEKNLLRRDLLADVLRNFSGPVILDADCGHTLPMATVPNGAWLTIEFRNGVLHGTT